jgi:hypothetical protein
MFFPGGGAEALEAIADDTPAGTKSFKEVLDELYNELKYKSSYTLAKQAMKVDGAMGLQTSTELSETEVYYLVDATPVLTNCKTDPNYIVSRENAIYCSMKGGCKSGVSLSTSKAHAVANGWKLASKAKLGLGFDVELSGEYSSTTTDTKTDTKTTTFEYNLQKGEYCLPAMAQFTAVCTMTVSGSVQAVTETHRTFGSDDKFLRNVCGNTNNIQAISDSGTKQLQQICNALQSPQTVRIDISPQGSTTPYQVAGCLDINSGMRK